MRDLVNVARRCLRARPDWGPRQGRRIPGLNSMLLSRLIRAIGLVHLVLASLVAALVVTEPSVRRYGDTLQVALPLLAWGCAATGGGGSEFALRAGLLVGITHASKAILGDAALNRRPNGLPGGFPSAHTGAAVLGASALVQGCLRGSPVGQAAVLIAAGFTGASRIAVGEHTIWQVLAGAILGWLCDRLLRQGPGRQRLVRLCSTARAGLRRRLPDLPPRRAFLLRAGLVCVMCLAVIPALI